MNVLIASSAIIARSYAILDWGWKLRNFNPLILENLQGEEVKYLPITSIYAMKSYPRSDDGKRGKFYYIMDGLERYPNDLTNLQEMLLDWHVIRNPANEGKVNDK